MGYETGIDLAGLLASRAVLAEALPGEPLYGYLARAGLPKQFVAARQGFESSELFPSSESQVLQ
jgi:hydroxymethylglutaryl-CoA lyase